MAVTARVSTHIPRRVDEAGAWYDATADDAAYAIFELAGGVVAQINSSWAVRVYRDELVEFQVDGTEGSAVAGLRNCRVQHRAATPKPVWNPDLPATDGFRAQWTEVPDNELFARVLGAPVTPRRFSFNQATATHWPTPELIEGCAAAGVEWVGLWREQTAAYGLGRTAAHLRSAGLAVSTLCRGGFFQREGWYDDNRRAVDGAHALGSPVLVLVSGGLPDGPRGRDIDGARARVADAIAQLAPHAQAAGVTLAIEPLHPMFASDRCVVSTMDQALSMSEAHPVGVVGVAVDTYHVWWDDRVYGQILRAGPRIATFQLADWTTPLPAGVLTGRALPGAGCVELTRLWRAVDAAGYTGPVEVEVFNDDLWAVPGPDILAATLAAYTALPHPYPPPPRRPGRA